MMRQWVTNTKSFVRRWVIKGIALITHYPGTVALFGFVSGVASFLLVEREQEKFAQMVSALMLVSWVWLALENLLRRSVASWFGFKLPPPLLSFATQLVHQESLFFVIPFFVITTVWNGGQLVFTLLLIIAAFISIVDPIYYRWLAAKRWLYFIFHGVTLFAVLLTALPIIFRLPTPKTYVLALGIAIFLSLPGVVRALPFNWWKRSLLTIVGVVVVAMIGLSVRAWIPPATLRLTEVALTDRLDDRNRSPENSLKVLTVEQLRLGLYAYTAIRAPRGLNERIYHVWRRNGRTVDRIALDISGGREAGYRAWSHKLNFPPYPSGRWQIHVVTEANQVIGILRFRVVESEDERDIEDQPDLVDELRRILPDGLFPREHPGKTDPAGGKDQESADEKSVAEKILDELNKSEASDASENTQSDDTSEPITTSEISDDTSEPVSAPEISDASEGAHSDVTSERINASEEAIAETLEPLENDELATPAEEFKSAGQAESASAEASQTSSPPQHGQQTSERPQDNKHVEEDQ